MAIVTVLKDEEALAAAAAERVTSLIDASSSARGSAIVCLTGGRTPRRLYERLADARQPWRSRIDWPGVHAFWGDERHVPPDHPDSNFGPKDEDHPMILRTIVDGKPASEIGEIRTK